MAARRMHQTTVRFGPDLWADIATQAERAGVSVAQYVRDAAMMRVAYTMGRDRDAHYEAARTGAARGAPGIGSSAPDFARHGRESQAQRAETRQARREAQALRDETDRRDAPADDTADSSAG